MIGWILLAVMTISDAGSDVLLSHGTKQVAQASDLRRWDILGIVARAIQNVNLVGAAILAAIHFGVFVALLSLWDLSLVIPMGALDYALSPSRRDICWGKRYVPCAGLGLPSS